jgi:hypothetical protein
MTLCGNTSYPSHNGRFECVGKPMSLACARPWVQSLPPPPKKAKENIGNQLRMGRPEDVTEKDECLGQSAQRTD